MNTDLLRRRIEEAYRSHNPDASSAHGALAWFAREARVHPVSVSRWVGGERTPSGPALAVLRLLERTTP